jgi:hypothetical protein
MDGAPHSVQRLSLVRDLRQLLKSPLIRLFLLQGQIFYQNQQCLDVLRCFSKDAQHLPHHPTRSIPLILGDAHVQMPS